LERLALTRKAKRKNFTLPDIYIPSVMDIIILGLEKIREKMESDQLAFLLLLFT
jgi:hypothetical protein